MELTKKDIDKYFEKKEKLEHTLADEMAFGNPSKTTLRKIEEFNRIIAYDELINLLKESKRKISYYETLLERHNISYLK